MDKVIKCCSIIAETVQNTSYLIIGNFVCMLIISSLINPNSYAHNKYTLNMQIAKCYHKKEANCFKNITGSSFILYSIYSPHHSRANTRTHTIAIWIDITLNLYIFIFGVPIRSLISL